MEFWREVWVEIRPLAKAQVVDAGTYALLWAGVAFAETVRIGMALLFHGIQDVIDAVFSWRSGLF